MLPTVFLSHGSPMHALQAGAAGRAWAQIGRRLPRPRAVLVASAHWETELPMVSTADRPETIHDFGGFPEELYKMRYAAPGAPEAAQRALDLLKGAGLPASVNGCRGLDHGAWVPLLYLYPGADVPVAQISVQPSLDAAHHLRLGAALAPLAREEVLVVGSGHMTHNLREWMLYVRRHGLQPAHTQAAPYVEEFRQWIDRALRADDRAALAAWLERAPHALRAHPSPEHFLPLPVAFAAAGPQPAVERIDLGVDAGVLAMDAYLFWPAAG
ncbi:MAG TPA: class III extradiol ring-cleavage dioxygenase [Burkholderiales bacterium]|nr:class III extradiol ring-cleavage dioxygenase [Burkholderiales bacterium]